MLSIADVANLTHDNFQMVLLISNYHLLIIHLQAIKGVTNLKHLVLPISND